MLIPIGNQILVKKISRREDSEILTDVDFDYDNRGEVVAIGPGARREDGTLVPIDDVEIGDKVYFSKYEVARIEFDSNDYYVVNASKLMAKEAKITK